MPPRKKSAFREVSAAQAKKDVERGGKLMEALRIEPDYKPGKPNPEQVQRTHKALAIVAEAQGRQWNMDGHGSPYNRVDDEIKRDFDKALKKGKYVRSNDAGDFEFKRIKPKKIPEIEKDEYIGFIVTPRAGQGMRRRGNSGKSLFGKLKNGHWVFLPSKYL